MKRRLPASGPLMISIDSGITPLPFDGAHGLCTECEGRPAFFRVQRPNDESARLLCGECVFTELAPPTSTEAEFLEQEAERLAEAERSGTPEQLGHMAEFLEEWWEGQEETIPPFVTEFVARHRQSAPPLASPRLEGTVSAEDMNAARLALLVMRGALCERTDVRNDRYVVEPSPVLVSRDAAADLLARIPKPVECHARVNDGLMTIRCRTIAEPSHVEARRKNEEYWAEQGGRFRELRAEHGEAYSTLEVFCLGCREFLVVTVADVERRDADYDVHPGGFNAGPPSGYLATNPEAARAAAAAGAVYLMKCYFAPNEREAEEEGRVIELRDTATWDQPQVYQHTPGDHATCERCGDRPATWLATDTRTTPWQERRVCTACTAEELAPHALAKAERFEQWVTRLSPKGRRSTSDDVADALERMERWWKVLPAPPVVAAALERCRAL